MALFGREWNPGENRVKFHPIWLDLNFNFQSQWEEMMMMTERQLKAVRAEKSDTSAIKKLQSDVKVLENKLQNKKDENSNLSREISDLKRYYFFAMLNSIFSGKTRVRAW